jgi:hypothetical protein
MLPTYVLDHSIDFKNAVCSVAGRNSVQSFFFAAVSWLPMKPKSVSDSPPLKPGTLSDVRYGSEELALLLVADICQNEARSASVLRRQHLKPTSIN